MVCYICGNPASLRCLECTRYVCEKHTKENPREYYRDYNAPTYKYVCSKCYDTAIESINKIIQPREEERKKAHWCDFCRETLEESTVEKFYGEVNHFPWQIMWSPSPESFHCLPKCGVCKKQFCEKHGQIIIQSLPGETNYFYRCIDHLLKPGKFGYYKADSYWDITFF